MNTHSRARYLDNYKVSASPANICSHPNSKVWDGVIAPPSPRRAPGTDRDFQSWPSKGEQCLYE